MKQSQKWLALAGVVLALGAALPASAFAKHGADDPAGHVRGADDGANHR